MPIQDLNPQDFAKNLAQQAGTYVSADISEENKQYIVKKVYEFCYITGDHLLKQYKEQFTDADAVVVIQFIGEWTFHKANDLITAGIRHEFWDTILQQIAFSALKSALHAHSEGYDQAKAAELIESQVAEAYKQCINHLVKAKAIPEDKVEEILAYSNVDKMAQEAAKNEAEHFEDDEKTLKYIAIALMLRKMPPEKVNNILNNFDEAEKQKILACFQIDNLETKVEPIVINQYIEDLKRNISLNAKPDCSEIMKSFKSLQAKYGDEEIINITMFERPKIQEFLSACLLEDGSNVTKVELSPHIVKILYSYLRSKLAAVS